MSKSMGSPIKVFAPGVDHKKDYFVDAEAKKKLTLAKLDLLRTFPLFGVCLLSLNYIEQPDELVDTLATDGYNLFYSANFVKKLKPGEVIFGLAHEVYHCIFRHVAKTRKGNRNHTIWNYAIDYFTNYDLKEMKVGEFITTIPILYDTKYAGWSSEAIYDDLKNDASYAGKGRVFDKHFEGGGDGQSSTKADEELESRWKGIFASAASAQQEHENRKGVKSPLPPYMRRLIDNLNKPQINWISATRRYIQRVRAEEFSFRRPQRTLIPYDIYLPSLHGDKSMFKAGVAVDTSGSIGARDLSHYISEFPGMFRVADNFEITAWCFGSGVVEESVTKITKRGKQSHNTLNHFVSRLGAGGGTDFASNWEWMKKVGYRPNILVVLTDGENYNDSPEAWGDSKYCPTIWLIKNEQVIKAPWGKTIPYQNLGKD